MHLVAKTESKTMMMSMETREAKAGGVLKRLLSSTMSGGRTGDDVVCVLGADDVDG